MKRTPRASGLHALAVTLVVGLACRGDELGEGLPAPAWHGERVSLGTDLVDEVCQGTLASFDRGVVQIEDALQLPANDETIAVWVVGDDEVTEQCQLAIAGGCAARSRVVLDGDALPHYLHELVHARVLQHIDSGKPLFDEGIAEALGGGLAGSCLGDEPCASAELEALLAARDSDLDFALYFAGGDLVHGMLADYGPADVLAFIGGLDHDTSPAATRSRYHDSFGSTLDDDYLTYRRGPLDPFTPMQLGCVAPAAPRTDAGGGVVLQANMDCASPAVLNDFLAAAAGRGAREGLVEWTFEITPEQAGAFVFAGDLAEGSILRFERCVPSNLYWWQHLDDGPWTYFSTLPPREPDGVVVLAPGLYRVTWAHTLDPQATLDVTFAPQCTFALQNCPEDQQCTIWNLCAAQVDEPAALGQACTQLEGDALACEAGTRCLGGVCVAECDATRPCGAGEACARERVCGPVCDLLADDCAPGMACVPSSDPASMAAGQGQCVATGPGQLLEPCRRREGGCGEQLSCEFLRDIPCNEGDFDGCCVPLCDPGAADPGCPEELRHCDPLADGPVGVCRDRL